MIAKPDVCYYHFPCVDGFAAALAVWKEWPDVEFRPINYGHDFAGDAAYRELHNRHVLFVDFFPGRLACEYLFASKCKVTVFDHHKTAEHEIAAAADSGKRQFDFIFDLERSGAGIAWDHLLGYRTLFVDTIEDRDLWRYQFGDRTRDLHAFLSAQPWEFETWARIQDRFDNSVAGQRGILVGGAAIRQKIAKDIAAWVEAPQWWYFDLVSEGPTFRDVWRDGRATGYVPVLNLPDNFASDTGHALLDRYPDAPFAGTYYYGADAMYWSLRSTDNRLDVGAIAKARGGGGHRNAAGYRIERKDIWR